VLFEPGVGVGFEYTDNAKLKADDKTSDLIASTYVGGRVTENEGALQYNASTTFNKYNYTQDSFEDQRYWNLVSNADWEMIKDHLNLFASDTFYQNSIFTLGSNTPDNIQNSNIFTFGANAGFRPSARQNFTLTPTFSQYYFEVLNTNNKQYALSANWNYQMFRLDNVGLNLSVRKINYTEVDIFGQSPDDTTFENMAVIFTGQRQRSSYTVNLGATNVKRDNGQETTGFTGFLNWLADVSSRSKFETLVSSDITDASGVSASGGGSDEQIAADVIRTSIVNLVYSRDDATLHTRVSARYNKIIYSDTPLDRIIRDFALRFSYPVTQLLSSGAYINYNRTEQLDTNRLDDRVTVGGNLRYNFSRKIHGLFDIKYRTKDSNAPSQNYDEFGVFVSLVYGFGDVGRPTRAGGG